MTLVLVGKTTLKGKTFTNNDSDGTIFKKTFGLPDHWYGGRVKEFRKVRDSKILMCLDRRDNVINLAYFEDELTDADRELLDLPTKENVEEPDEGKETVGDSITDDTDVVQNVLNKGGKKK
jgi:hypothetical protein